MARFFHWLESRPLMTKKMRKKRVLAMARLFHWLESSPLMKKKKMRRAFGLGQVAAKPLFWLSVILAKVGTAGAGYLSAGREHRNEYRLAVDCFWFIYLTYLRQALRLGSGSSPAITGFVCGTVPVTIYVSRLVDLLTRISCRLFSLCLVPIGGDRRGVLPPQRFGERYSCVH
jgi:hypothetical protein